MKSIIGLRGMKLVECYNHPHFQTEENPTYPNNYRPIALTSCVCKTFECLVWCLESNNILTEYQSGFRKRLSTTVQLVRLVSYI